MAAVAVSSEAPTKNRAPGQQTKSKPVAPGSLHRTPKLTPAEISTLAPPVFWRLRNDFFDKLYQEQCIAYKAKEFPIAVTLPDGKVIPATAFSTTPDEIARSISRKLAEKVFVAKVDDVLWDLTRPLEESCHLELLDWDSREARNVFWHSSAHVLGHALERGLGIKLSVGPPLEEGGFFYEGDAGRPLSEADYPLIEGCVADAVSSKRPFQRLVISKADALAMFAYNPMKTTILQSKVPEDGYCTVYRCGELIDPCRGPHLPDMGRVKSFELTRCSASYFLGKSENASLQRVYGISFPKESLLKEWRVLQEEAARRDHRAIGKHQELWMWNELSPGSTFFYPHGARIYNTLVEYMRRQYRMRGFEEVITPNMYNSKLWKISGHHQKYRENLFYTQVEKEEFALKPMNCPGHCLLFSVRPRSYRELPLRIADFGVLHRNEISGALSGLIRVRRFQQDDAHIFCTPEQVRSEILGALNFLKEIYDTLGFSFTLSLSTRPANFLGTERMWAIAEAQLQDALNDFCGIPELPDPFAAAAAVVSSTEPGEKAAPFATPAAVFSYDGSPFAQRKVKRLVAEKKLPKIPFNRTWERNEGDGAFYGPKIDVTVMDALHRKHQCGTIQLDFQLPLRFNLSYVTDGERHEIHFPGEKGGPEETISGDCGAEGGDGAHCGHSAPAVTMHTLHPSVDGTMSGFSQQPSTAMKTGGHHLSAAHSLERPLDPGHARPIMIHRAIFGSLERCIAILTEHYAGKWPFWLSPRQAVVVPVSKAVDAYARSVRDSLYAASFYCDVDLSDHKLEKKIRTNQLAQYNYILVVGHEEQEKQLVNVRCRENKRHGMRSLQEVLEAFTALRDTQDRAEVFQTRAPEAAKAIASAIKLEEEVATQERKKEEEFESMEENKSILSYEPTQHLEPMPPL